jgi:uncharacterized oligopeptide transporter (OPT) family protein
MFSKSNYENNGSIVNLRWAPILMVLLVVLYTFVTDMPLFASVVAIVGVWLATAMSAQTVGQSGFNPMEVFGIIVLIAAKAVSDIGQTEAFFVAAVVAIACGLVGDVMNDFKAGYILHSNPKAQWYGEFIGGIVGAFSAVAVFYVILVAYGPEAFGSPEGFVAPQAGMVAAMVGGIPNLTWFLIGLVAAVVLYVINFPVMTLGLGVYLPFYLSATAFVGGLVRFIVMKAFPKYEERGTGNIIASGLLGGEAVVGVIIALTQAIPALLSI